MEPVNGAFDVRLMRTLLLLVTECSVSRTAEILGQTQPTVSLALKRLRELIGDPILVRSGGVLVPTERGLELRATLQRLLVDIDALLAPPPSFDPEHTKRRFRIAAANCLDSAFLPRIFARLAEEAPKASIDVATLPGHDELMAHLADGSLDLVVGNWPRPPEQLRLAPLLSTPIRCVVAGNHRLAGTIGPLSMDRYLAERHLSPSADVMKQYSPIDGRLMELGLNRHIAASVPEYAIVPHMLAGSDLIFTTGAPFAEQMAETGNFAVIDAPVEFGCMDFYLLWHDCKHHSPAHIWFRHLVKAAVADLKGSADAGSQMLRVAAE
ncbi:LysR family transcriptional regulator [Pleomorphomonas sp. PLEO]|uniref:LysR family transcriptional regulator n=1 Tax=Pleomorphomonas sp. PLEO TaxID=3239306 RepID=UPI00351E00EC